MLLYPIKTWHPDAHGAHWVISYMRVAVTPISCVPSCQLLSADVTDCAVPVTTIKFRREFVWLDWTLWLCCVCTLFPSFWDQLTVQRRLKLHLPYCQTIHRDIGLTLARVVDDWLIDWIVNDVDRSAVLVAVTGEWWLCTVTKLSCSPQCDDRCYGTQANQCCHPECAGGCDGPTKNDCWVCQLVHLSTAAGTEIGRNLCHF